MNPPITIDIQDEHLSDLLMRRAPAHSLDNLVAYVEELLNLGAVARIVQRDTILIEFKSAGQFSCHVDKVLASRVSTD